MNEDQEPTKYQKVKQHLKENRKVYLTGAGCLCIGFVGGKHFQRPIEVLVESAPTFNNTVAPVIAPVMNNIQNNLGPCCKIVQRLEDEELWPKIATLAEQLAEEHDVSVDAVRKMLSRHFRGDLEHVFNKHYRPYGVTTTG
jgi:hypothetical protein